MKILQLHNRYQIRGGEEGVLQAEQALLTQYGHAVEQLQVSNDDIVSPIDKAMTAVQAVYSGPSKRQVAAAIATHQPDVVHVHNFFPRLSPSIYDACIEQGVPVVQTLHNYRLACVKAMLFRDQQVCEDCIVHNNPWPGVKHGCYRDSQAQSAVVAAMLIAHRWRRTWQEKVDAFITLTNFQRQKLVQAGLPSEKIHIKPNFLAAADAVPPRVAAAPFLLFVGRLSPEKGIDVALAAYAEAPDLPPLKIVGDGPERTALMAKVAAAGLETRVQFLGFQVKDQVLALMQQATALIFPSIWYEGFPLTLVEALGMGLPPIASNLGSMAEIIADGQTGLLFEPQNPTDLARQVRVIVNDTTLRATLSQAAHQVYQSQYTPEVNYAQLMAIYQSVIEAKKAN